MVVWKVLLQGALTGAILGPLAGAAFGPVELKRPPDPPWRHLLHPNSSVDTAPIAYNYGLAPPQDLGPPVWLDGPARRLGWHAIYEPLEPQPALDAPPFTDAPLAEPAAAEAGADQAALEQGVRVHRAASEAAAVAAEAKAAENAQPAAPAAEPPAESFGQPPAEPLTDTLAS